MTSESKTANAIGGKTARACDSCCSKRARFFCTADDAFLCQSCDVSVHSANLLASRHERVRLETSSNKSRGAKLDNSTPSWHQGFTRKARTPRNGKNRKNKDEEKIVNYPHLPFVPEIGSEYSSDIIENEEQLLYRVPVFDPFAAELCSVPDEVLDNLLHVDEGDETTTINDLDILSNNFDVCDDLGLPEFLSSETELAEFAADVESLLGTGLNDNEEARLNAAIEDKSTIKIEIEDEEMRAVVACHLNPELDMASEAIKWNFEYESPLPGEEETSEQKVIGASEFVPGDIYCNADAKRKMLLRLNHEAVINAWPNQSSPWTDGIRPNFNPDDCWPDFLETCHQPYGGIGGHVRGDDGGREARVSRYREKRRTRLFSKKIRYEVRKLNAEKRPRLKGRFVKRTSFSPTGFPSYLMNKR